MRFKAGILFFVLFGLNLFPGNSHTATLKETTDLKHGKTVYERYCTGCHGVKGDGKGLYAEGLNPRPRNFSQGIFKWTGGQAGSIPSDLDLFMTISEGVHGTSMPSWQALRESERHEVIEYIKTFSKRFREEKPAAAVFIYPPPPLTPAETDKGRLIYEKMGCAACHGKEGRGDGPSASTLLDDWGNPILPANFSKGIFKTGQEEWKIYRSIANGLGGTPMPSFSDQLKPEETWELVYYIRSLKD